MQNIGKQFLLLSCLVLAFMAAISVISSPRNAIGELFFYLVIGSGLISLLNPRRGVFIVLFYTAYLDFFKRLLPLGGGTTMQDVMYSMAVAPISALAVTVGVILAFVFDRIPNWSRYRKLFFLTVFITFISASLVFWSRRSGTATNMLREIANYSGYVGLVLALPVLFPTRKDVQRLLKYTLYLFIPVPLYFAVQYSQGLMWWEDVYLKSGLSLEARQFGEHIFRYFATMNNAQSLSTLMCLLAVFSPLMIYPGKRFSPLGYLRPGIFLIFASFLLCAYYTFSRGGWVTGFAALGALIFFQRKATVGLFYMFSFSFIASIFIFSGAILKSGVLSDWTEAMLGGGGDERNMATRLGTFTSRLVGMRNMMTKDYMWEPFGVGSASISSEGAMMKYYTHDNISSFIVNYGYVPAILVAFATAWGLYIIHKAFFRLEVGFWRNIFLVGLAGSFGIFIGSIGNSAQLGMFPVNVYFWFFAGLVGSSLTNGLAEVSPVEVRSEVDGADSLSLRPGRGLVRRPA